MNNKMNINIPRNISRFSTTNKNNYIDLIKSDVYLNGKLVILDNENIDIFYEYDKETMNTENDILVLDMSTSMTNTSVTNKGVANTSVTNANTSVTNANGASVNNTTTSSSSSINKNDAQENKTLSNVSGNTKGNTPSEEQLDMVLSEIVSGCEKKYNITTMQLSFPYTLLKRSNFQLSKLIESTLYHNQQEQLLASIRDANIFIFYDNFNAANGNNSNSNACHCDISTYHIINKFITHLDATRNIHKNENDNNENNNNDYKVFYLNYQLEKHQPSSPGLESEYNENNNQDSNQEPLPKQPITTTKKDVSENVTNTPISTSPVQTTEISNMFANNKEIYEKKLAALNKHRAAMHKSRVIAAGTNSVPGSPTTINSPNGQSSSHKNKAHSRKLSLKLLIPNPDDQYTLNKVSKSTPSILGSPSAKDGSNGTKNFNGKGNMGNNGKDHYMNKKSYGSSTNRAGARYFLKKDSCYYSPSTLNKYFSFTRPITLSNTTNNKTISSSNTSNNVSDTQTQNKLTLPTWLDFLNDSNMNENDCLLQILERFQTLENLENDRLLKSMDVNREVEDVKTGNTSITASNNNNNTSVYQFNYETLNTNQFYHLNTPDCRSCKNLDFTDTNVPTHTSQASTPTYVFSQGIKYFNKNRYNNILPYEHTRVKLLADPQNNSTMALNSPSGIYFNANHIRIPKLNPNYQYIATQAPLPSTFDDFWQVCLAEKIEFIISLNSMDELNLKKWDQYWNNDYLHLFHIEQVYLNDSVENLSGCMLRVFEISPKLATSSDSSKNEKTETRKIVYHLQYSNWFDSASVVSTSIIEFMNIKNKLVNNPTAYIEFLKTCNSDPHAYSKSKALPQSSVKHYDTPLLVLCSAGCGRTGVFITIDFLLNLLNDHENPVRNIDFWKFPYDLIFIVVNELRRQRISMVQNLQQYIMCYQTIIEYLTHNYDAIANGSEKH